MTVEITNVLESYIQKPPTTLAIASCFIRLGHGQGGRVVSVRAVFVGRGIPEAQAKLEAFNNKGDH